MATVNVRPTGNDKPARLKPIAGSFAAKVSVAQRGADVD